MIKPAIKSEDQVEETEKKLDALDEKISKNMQVVEEKLIDLAEENRRRFDQLHTTMNQLVIGTIEPVTRWETSPSDLLDNRKTLRSSSILDELVDVNEENEDEDFIASLQDVQVAR